MSLYFTPPVSHLVKNQTENSQVDRSEIKSLSRQYHNEELSRVAPPCPLKRLVRP